MNSSAKFKNALLQNYVQINMIWKKYTLAMLFSASKMLEWKDEINKSLISLLQTLNASTSAWKNN